MRPLHVLCSYHHYKPIAKEQWQKLPMDINLVNEVI